MSLKQDIERLVQERDRLNESINTLSEELRFAQETRDGIEHQISEVSERSSKFLHLFFIQYNQTR